MTVASQSRNKDVTVKSRAQSEGLFRTTLAGPGQTLADAFANVERSANIAHRLRHVKRDLMSARVLLSPQEGQGYWELTRIRRDLFVIVENFSYKNERSELVPGDGLVQFNFKISGDLTIETGHTTTLRFNRPSLLIWAQPQGVNIREWTAPSAFERNVAISVYPEFLAEHFVNSIGGVPEQLKTFLSSTSAKLAYCQLPLNAEMFEIANRLINNPFTGSLALVYTEALTLELLCCAVSSCCALSEKPSVGFSERDMRCLYAARDLLMRKLSPPPTLRNLARTVGMAETKVTRDFKAMFGETVFEFSLRCRMQHALSLLRDKHWSVAKASEAVGYTHATSFATAFRRHFGIRPIDARHFKATGRRVSRIGKG